MGAVHRQPATGACRGRPSRPVAGAERLSAGPKVVVVMPAYNAAKTLRMTYAELPHDVVDLVIVVDDGSSDETAQIARELGLELFVHDRNYGYGANQKTCYREALKAHADIVVMVHPDYQYEPKLLTAMAGMIASGVHGVCLLYTSPSPRDYAASRMPSSA